ncbi:MAG: hypothetical protein U0168_19110 [Nannocystaceae bacterium]
MSRELASFVEDFVVPLLGGGDVWVGRPLRLRERDEWARALGPRVAPQLSYWRLRRAQLLVANPVLEEPDADELALWLGLHNLLVFDHPDRARVWTRATTWRKLEGVTRTLLTLPQPQAAAELLARHVTIGAFVELARAELVVSTPGGELRAAAPEPGPRKRLRGAVAGAREQTASWWTASHAPETDRLVPDALRASPLTCLLRPLQAPPGWSPLHCAVLLRSRAFARAVCHAWASHKDWTRQGGAVMAALLPSLGGASVPAPEPVPGGQLALPGAVVPCDPADVAAIVGALVHLHLLKVLELDTRVGLALGSRDPGILSFLALPLLLPTLAPVMGLPMSMSTDTGPTAAVARRWTEYVDHLEELVPRSVVENLLSTLVPRIVKPL